MIIIGLDPVIQLQEQWQDNLSNSFSICHSTEHKESFHLSLLRITSYKLENLPTLSYKLAAILDMKIKSRLNCQNGIKFEIRDPKNHENDILHENIGQTIAKRIFKMTDGGDFGLLPITAYAHTFERDTPPILLCNLQRRQNNWETDHRSQRSRKSTIWPNYIPLGVPAIE